MKLLISSLCLGLSMVVGVYAISDVPVTDPAYRAVQKSVQKGVLTLVDGQKFLPNQSVNRKELAVALDKIMAAQSAQQLQLSNEELKELAKLAKSFKAYLSKQDTSTSAFRSRVSAIEESQKVVHHDMTEVSDKVNGVEKSQEGQKNLIIGAMALGVLGILL